MGNRTVFYLFIYLRAEDRSPQRKSIQIYLKQKAEEVSSCKELSRVGKILQTLMTFTLVSSTVTKEREMVLRD